MPERNKLKTDLDKLQEIVDWFDSDDLDLEEAISKFDQGVKKADEIKKELEQLENKITVLSEKFEGK